MKPGPMPAERAGGISLRAALQLLAGHVFPRRGIYLEGGGGPDGSK